MIILTTQMMDNTKYNEVVAIVNTHIDESYEKLSSMLKKENLNEEPSIYDVLMKAQAMVQSKRDAGDKRVVLRSAEYYLKSRALTAKGDIENALNETSFFTGVLKVPQIKKIIDRSKGSDFARIVILILGMGGGLFYDFLKAIGYAEKFIFGTTTILEAIESTPGHLPTPPGGAIWGAMGCVDGVSDDGMKKGRPVHMKMLESIRIPQLPQESDRFTIHRPTTSGPRPSMGNETRAKRGFV